MLYQFEQKEKHFHEARLKLAGGAASSCVLKLNLLHSCIGRASVHVLVYTPHDVPLNPSAQVIAYLTLKEDGLLNCSIADTLTSECRIGQGLTKLAVNMLFDYLTALTDSTVTVTGFVSHVDDDHWDRVLGFWGSFGFELKPIMGQGGGNVVRYDAELVLQGTADAPVRTFLP